MPEWPPLPRTVRGLAGTVRVRQVPEKKLVAEHGDVWGVWCPEERVIKLRRGLEPRVGVHTLLHELVHSALDDSGIELAAHQVEPICDTLASAMLHAHAALWKVKV